MYSIAKFMMLYVHTYITNKSYLNNNLLSFAKASTPNQTQAGLGTRVYRFTAPGYCTAKIRLAVMVLSQHQVSSSKLADLVIHVMPDV